jgi:hypothetical protein
MGLSFQNFEYRRDLSRQRILFRECFPETIGSPIATNEYYMWKFHSKIGELNSVECTASIDGVIVGYYAAIPFRYRNGIQHYNAAMVCDVMTSVSARGKGVFKNLGIYSTNEFRNLGFDFSTGFPIRKEVIPGHLKVGWQINFKLPIYIKILKFNAICSKFYMRWLIPFLNLLAKWIIKAANYALMKDHEDIIFTNHRSDQIATIVGLNEFYEKWSYENGIRLVKDTDFLNWRLNSPDIIYNMTIARSGSEVVGVVISREDIMNGIPVLGIVDFCILVDFLHISSSLMRELEKFSGQTDAEIITVMMSSYWFKKYALLSNFFIKSPYSFKFISKKMRADIPDDFFYDEKNWHLMWIDSDDL